MALELPSEVTWVLDLLGYQWPEANEDLFHEAAEAWRTFANELSAIEGRGVGAAGQVVSANSGDAVDAFSDAWRKFSDGGSGYISDARETAGFFAFVLDAIAVEVVASKLLVIGQLVALAVEIISAQAAAPFTFGLSEAGALGATQVTRLAVREILNKLRQAIVEKVEQITEKASLKALKKLAGDFVKEKAEQLTKEKVKQFAKDKAKEFAKEKANELFVETGKEAVKSGVTATAQDLITQGVNVHYGEQKNWDVQGAVDKGWDEGSQVVKDKAQEVKDSVTPSNIVSSATDKATDWHTYTDAAQGAVSDRYGDTIQHHVNSLAGRPDPAPASETASDGGGSSGSSETATATATASASSGDGDSGGDSAVRSHVRSVFG